MDRFLKLSDLIIAEDGTVKWNFPYSPEVLGVIYDKSSWTQDDFDSDFTLNEKAVGYDSFYIEDNKLIVGLPYFLQENDDRANQFISFNKMPYTCDLKTSIEIVFDYAPGKYYSGAPFPPPAFEEEASGALVMRTHNPNDWITLQKIQCFSLVKYGDKKIRLALNNHPTVNDVVSDDYVWPNPTQIKLHFKIADTDVTSGAINEDTSEEIEQNGAKELNIYRYELGGLASLADAYPGAKWTISSILIKSDTIKNPQILCVGDSKTAIPVDGELSKRYGEKLGVLLGKEELTYAGGGNRTLEANKSADYLVVNGFSADIITLNIGRNDYASGISEPVMEENYIETVSKLKSILNPGGIFIHILPIEEGAGSQAALKNWITSQFPSDMLYDADDYGWNPATMTSDDVHPNDLGTDNLSQGLFDFISNI